MQVTNRLFIGFLAIFLVCAPVSAQSVMPMDVDDLQHQHTLQTDPSGILWAKASALGDWPTAIVAIHQLLEKDPSNTFLQDSLAAMYLRTGQAATCLAWCQRCLQTRPDAPFLLAIAGQLALDAGQIPAALTHWERLLQLRPSAYYHYQVAALQFRLGRYGECATALNQLAADAAVRDAWIHLSWEGGEGDVPLLAAVYNLQGNLDGAMGRRKEARKAFRAALDLAPEFGLAKGNLRGM
jgi:tetratricopeptide (TPR) repeat protein